MVKPIDRLSTLSASDAPKSANASRLSGLLASSLLLVIGAAVCLLIISIAFKKIDSVSAYQYKPITMISYKEYAALKIESNNQFKCLSQLYGKESAWNPNAQNGSHYGIPQGKSKYLSTLNGYHQIDWGLDYLFHRYGVDTNGYINACKALQHFKTKGWH
jgi:hypothetical protein